MVVDPLNLNQTILAEGKTMNQKPTNQRFSTKILSEIIVLVAMAGALSLFSYSLSGWPQGGSINLGMLPIFWLAYRRGPKIGIFAGAVFGVVDLAIEPFVLNPAQFILDYPLAFALLGVAGFFRKIPVVGVIVGGTGRFISHFVSGVIYWSYLAPPGWSPVAYSLAYNGGYMLPSTIVCAVIIGILQKTDTINIHL